MENIYNPTFEEFYNNQTKMKCNYLKVRSENKSNSIEERYLDKIKHKCLCEIYGDIAMNWHNLNIKGGVKNGE